MAAGRRTHLLQGQAPWLIISPKRKSNSKWAPQAVCFPKDGYSDWSEMEFSILFRLFSFKVLIYISWMAQDVGYFLICLLDIHTLSFENYLLVSLAHPLVGFFHFRVLSFLSFLCFLVYGYPLSNV